MKMPINNSHESARRARYVMVVGLISIAMLALPYLLGRALPERPTPQLSAVEVQQSLPTAEAWPLTFGYLNDCQPTGGPDIVRLSCPGTMVTLFGQRGVRDLPLVVDRAIRAMNHADTPTMHPIRWTDTALRIAPESLPAAQVGQVFVSDYYWFGEGSFEKDVTPAQSSPNFDPFHDELLSRTVSFYRLDDGAEQEGTMVHVQVTARGVKEHQEEVRKLLRSVSLSSPHDAARSPMKNP